MYPVHALLLSFLMFQYLSYISFLVSSYLSFIPLFCPCDPTYYINYVLEHFLLGLQSSFPCICSSLCPFPLSFCLLMASYANPACYTVDPCVFTYFSYSEILQRKCSSGSRITKAYSYLSFSLLVWW